jgi:hypothetical protein
VTHQSFTANPPLVNTLPPQLAIREKAHVDHAVGGIYVIAQALDLKKFISDFFMLTFQRRLRRNQRPRSINSTLLKIIVNKSSTIEFNKLYSDPNRRIDNKKSL